MSIIRPSLTMEAKMGINKLRKTDSQKFEDLLKGKKSTIKDSKDPIVNNVSKQPAVVKGKKTGKIDQNVSQKFPKTIQSPCPICGAMRYNMKSHLSKVHQAQTGKPSKQSQSKVVKPNQKRI